jgi:hypothetical protein
VIIMNMCILLLAKYLLTHILLIGNVLDDCVSEFRKRLWSHFVLIDDNAYIFYKFIYVCIIWILL